MKRKKKSRSKRGKTKAAWLSMRNRCLNLKAQHYKDYGGRGISICDRWNSFENFLNDMGEAPKGFSLDRIDNNGDYCPENCRWATMQMQCRNRRSNRLIEFRGVSKTLTEWAEILGLSRAMLNTRLSNWKDVEKAFCTPPGTRPKSYKKAVFATFRGESRPVSEWAKSLGITYQTMLYRLENWPNEEAFTISKYDRPRDLASRVELVGSDEYQK